MELKMSDCLVLNADYRPLSYLPLSTIGWQQAVKLSFLGRIKILETYDDWEVHSPSTTIKVPALAITKDYMKYKRAVRFSRRNLYLRDLYQCQYCHDTFNNEDLTIDHVIPISKGGKTTWENCVTACYTCNFNKGDKHKLPRRLPFKPEYWHLVGNTSEHLHWHIRHPSWRDYLDVS
jgi:5-methylcytosine-specific restriction endonuclease McrA